MLSYVFVQLLFQSFLGFSIELMPPFQHFLPVVTVKETMSYRTKRQPCPPCRRRFLQISKFYTLSVVSQSLGGQTTTAGEVTGAANYHFDALRNQSRFPEEKKNNTDEEQGQPLRITLTI